MKRTINKGLALALALCLVLTLLPSTVLAASDAPNNIFDISEGNITIAAGGATNTLKVTYGSVPTTTDDISSTTNITITGQSTANTVAVATGVTANITLSGVNIATVYDTATSPFSIATGSIVNLTLVGENTLISGVDDTADKSGSSARYAALNVPEGATLNITEASAGVLNTTGGHSAAGIGGNYEGSAGTIEINGGTVNARCGTASYHGNAGAGIGGGSDASGGTITITGSAKVTAVGGERASGIGGGWCGNGGIITIGTDNGSAQPVVNASTYLNSNNSSYPSGSGIGNGSFINTVADYNDSYTISIYGGEVTATGYDAGIGGNSNDLPQDRSINISGANTSVTAIVID